MKTSVPVFDERLLTICKQKVKSRANQLASQYHTYGHTVPILIHSAEVVCSFGVALIDMFWRHYHSTMKQG
jgi:hypothetical protein